METGHSNAARVTFGIRVPNSGPLASPQSIATAAKEAEALGFHSIWVHDHDYIRAMKALWTSHPSSYEGRFISFRDAEIFPKPLQKPHPPIWVGGWTEAAMKRTAMLGDGWLPAWLTPEDIGSRYRQLKEMARQFGRDGEAIHLGIEVYASIDEDSSKAKKNALGTFQASRGTYEREMTLEYLESVSLIGSPDEIREKVRAYADAGVSHFEIKFIYPTMDRHLEMMELFAKEVLQKLS